MGKKSRKRRRSEEGSDSGETYEKYQKKKKSTKTRVDNVADVEKETGSKTETAHSSDDVHGFRAFCSIPKNRSLSLGEVRRKWDELSRREQKACAKYESLTTIDDSDLEEPVAKGAEGQQEVLRNGGRFEGEVKAATPTRSPSMQLVVDEPEDDEEELRVVDSDGVGDGAADEGGEGDDESVDDRNVFVTGLHIFEQRSGRVFRDDDELFDFFSLESLETRMKLWNRAREDNYDELLNRFEKKVAEGKRPRAISLISRLEMADRVQHFWEGKVSAMAAELKDASASMVLAIHGQYKLRHQMRVVLNDLWHISVMERLVKGGTGLRRLLREACFGPPRYIQQSPWGKSFVDGEAPQWDKLRDTSLIIRLMWPRLCSSPLRPAVKMPSSHAKLVYEEVIEQHPKTKTPATQKKRKVSIKEATSKQFEEDASSTLNSFEIFELDTPLSSFGSFETAGRLAECLLERLAAANISTIDETTVETVEVTFPLSESRKCFNVRSLSGCLPLTSGVRVFYEKESGKLDVRCIQLATSFVGGAFIQLRQALKVAAPLLCWNESPAPFDCPSDAAICRQLASVGNLELGCALDTATNFCRHAETDVGGLLVAQLLAAATPSSLNEQQAKNVVGTLLSVEKTLSKLVEALLPSVALQMRATTGDCRLGNKTSLFSGVNLIGQRGQHYKSSSADVGVRAIFNCPFDSKGKRKLVLPTCEAAKVVETASSGLDSEPLSINLKHGSVCLVPAKMSFTLTRDDKILLADTPKCLTLEFFCANGLIFPNHAENEVRMQRCFVLLERDYVEPQPQLGRNDETFKDDSVSCDGRRKLDEETFEDEDVKKEEDPSIVNTDKTVETVVHTLMSGMANVINFVFP